MLTVTHINKSFKKNKVLDNITFNIDNNEVIGLLGPNGAGKTTLLKIISKLILEDSGNILLNNKKINMEDLGTVFDGNRNLYWNISVKENFYYFSALKGSLKKEVDYFLRENSHFFESANFLNKKFGELSLGQKQMVSIINAFIFNPELLCLDEPSNGLDIYYEEKMIELIKWYSLKNKNKILISSHDILFLYKIVDRFIVIDKGKILGLFSKEQLSFEEVRSRYIKLLEEGGTNE
ncbi:ABC transporter-like protein [Fusobacterium necrophorum subsp. funduliforme B35]|uniref:ABC transporter ATP-binding protein n=1 Tax=Fusobacterium necrophorum TaxID=859 RepID=UPI0004359BE0|nr:ABC transporter ATP-binding protein [Fusobacterium necrophorum]EYD68534.1 ABC transporter-like protein [Fusobacterium necrophorum subsp. funduliforme B35]